MSLAALFSVVTGIHRQEQLVPWDNLVCIVGITRLMPGVDQPDPPGLIHDDLRLLPPWRGSSLLWGIFLRHNVSLMTR